MYIYMLIYIYIYGCIFIYIHTHIRYVCVNIYSTYPEVRYIYMRVHVYICMYVSKGWLQYLVVASTHTRLYTLSTYRHHLCALMRICIYACTYKFAIWEKRACSGIFFALQLCVCVRERERERERDNLLYYTSKNKCAIFVAYLFYSNKYITYMQAFGESAG
jgi:hypothetical protein